MIMKKILLVSNYVFHYRQKVYNYFADRFKEDGYEFHVASNEFQDAGYDFRFIAHTEPLASKGYKRLIQELEPAAVIVFLHLKDKIQLPIVHFCNRKCIPVIFWNKGVSDTDPNNVIKNIIYHHLHNKCNALVTYTPEMITNFKEKNRSKLFIGYNTVNCSNIDKSKYNKEEIKKKYNIKESKVILYVSRMKESKRISVLLDALANVQDVAVVAMGSGITPELQEKFDSAPNLYYLGQKYGEEGNEVWSIGDVFSIPASVGLGINEAIFWGIPTVTMNGFQPPEIYYLKEGKTGYITKDEKEYKEKLLGLLADERKLSEMKKACEEEYIKEVSIDCMYKGFIDAVNYCFAEKK